MCGKATLHKRPRSGRQNPRLCSTGKGGGGVKGRGGGGGVGGGGGGERRTQLGL